MGEREVLWPRRRQHWLLMKGGKSVLAWGLVAVMFALASAAVGQPTMTQLLHALNLSDYPPGLWPPAFKGQTDTGQAVSLADFKGRVVLVNFWASWCAECRPEMLPLQRLQTGGPETFAPRNH